ncbi:hypothetical protein B0I32_104426 [Nonomuraea fuscirosea]|uniref:Uncharacterized protein n=1 Tax=Nonomuraea fuscirosea TaxID=1291556 RepID=A0A2T0N5L3_9ACTN|nr:hypothetical protein [Nonomuraea fuscirosea]PRX67669.1 hypothetical protein B0I32_104426 [Nonomuraea fuscirosea]
MDDWLTDTRTSYDTVASSADQLRGAVGERPYVRAALALFADLLRDAGFAVETQLTVHLDEKVPGAMLFARPGRA